jgi:hypothetical protein
MKELEKYGSATIIEVPEQRPFFLAHIGLLVSIPRYIVMMLVSSSSHSQVPFRPGLLDYTRPFLHGKKP